MEPLGKTITYDKYTNGRMIPTTKKCSRHAPVSNSLARLERLLIDVFILVRCIFERPLGVVKVLLDLELHVLEEGRHGPGVAHRGLDLVAEIVEPGGPGQQQAGLEGSGACGGEAERAELLVEPRPYVGHAGVGRHRRRAEDRVVVFADRRADRGDGGRDRSAGADWSDEDYYRSKRKMT